MRYFETRKFHSEVKEACRSHKAALLSLSYEQDIDAFPAPPKTTIGSYYVGLEYRDTRIWFWSSGEPLTYPAMYSDKSSEYYRPSSCGGIKMNKGAAKRRYVFLIEKAFCTNYTKLPFICQRFGRYTTFT